MTKVAIEDGMIREVVLPLALEFVGEMPAK